MHARQLAVASTARRTSFARPWAQLERASARSREPQARSMNSPGTRAAAATAISWLNLSSATFSQLAIDVDRCSRALASASPRTAQATTDASGGDAERRAARATLTIRHTAQISGNRRATCSSEAGSLQADRCFSWALAQRRSLARAPTHKCPGSSVAHPVSREVFSPILRARTLQRQCKCKWIKECAPASRPQLKRTLAPTIETDDRLRNNRSPCRAARFTPGRRPACPQRPHSSQANWIRT